MLDILFGLIDGPVTGEGEVESSQNTRGHEPLQLLAVEETRGATPVAEEQPGTPRRTRRLALLQKAAKRRNARPGPDHDDRDMAPRQPKGVVWAQMHPDRLPTISQECRRHTAIRAIGIGVPDGRHGQMNGIGIHDRA
ncbi:Uncharacterised protein [Mycobacteroides abscessus subsp. abscessus]|nr:Uncharacterised protein [Mycobacteroides abscessus subsp. abscessus]